MRIISTGALCAVLGLVLVGGCAKHDDTSSASSTASDDASPTTSDGAVTNVAASADPAVAASPAPNASATGTSTTVERADGSSVTMNGGARAGAIDIPMYPVLTPKSGSPIDVTADGARTQMGTYTSPDDFATVDGWYKAHLSSDFKAEHMSMNDMQESTYHQGEGDALPTRAVAVTATKDATSGKMITTVTAVVKEKVSSP